MVNFSFIFPVLLSVLTLFLSRSNGQVQFSCVDKSVEFKAANWKNKLFVSVKYAETAEDLPGDLKGQAGLEADGIFYVEGTGGVMNYYYEISPKVEAPIYVYVRYYGAANPNVTTMQVSPEHPDSLGRHYLHFGPEFQWQEEYVQIYYYRYGHIYIDMSNAVFGEYFLIDKLILAHSGVINDIEEIKGLCGWSDSVSPPPSTTTTSTTSTSTTTTSSTTTTTQSPVFVCEEEGSFSDPSDCSQFHVCTENDLGDLTDNLLTCPANLVWCQRDLVCNYPRLCPCSL